jgi:predicted aspartyl protease
MKRLTTSFERDRELIVIEGRITGPRGSSGGRLVLDTGAAMTTITPELAELIGYGARDGRHRTRVHTAVGSEDGFALDVAEFAALGTVLPGFRVNVFDLGHDDIDGLLGLNFLHRLNYEVRSAEHRILVEPIARPSA